MTNPSHTPFRKVGDIIYPANQSSGFSVSSLNNGESLAALIVKAVNEYEELKAKLENYESMEYPTLKRINDELVGALKKCKARCAGDKIPYWADDWQTTHSRGIIMDIVDATLERSGVK